jgi:myo-inositol-1(or 4)-monophosphatase
VGHRVRSVGHNDVVEPNAISDGTSKDISDGAVGPGTIDPGLATELLELATRAAERAGRLLIDERPDDSALTFDTKTSSTDVVTEMDRRSEELLHGLLLAARPGDGYVGEEGADSSSQSGITWVVDPIDGTVNYLYRNPVWAVSIAACVRDETAADGLRAIAGVVHAPLMGETFWSAEGAGSHLRTPRDQRRLSVRGETRLSHALVATGFAYEPDKRIAQAKVIQSLLPVVRDVRRPGSAALDICFVAAGRVDAYFERGTHLWDRAAAALIAREAGARLGGLHGRVESVDLAIAANEPLFPALHDALVAADVLGGY